MIKAASIYTHEIDNINNACLNLKKQLNEKISLLSNTVGIVQCHPEFLEAGVMEPLCGELGIPLVGGTTIACATNDGIGNVMLSVLVLTSDDVEFAVSHTEGFRDDYRNAVNRSFNEALAGPHSPLRLAIVFSPIIDNLAGDYYVEAIEDVCGKTPVFGTFSVDDSMENFAQSASICNNDSFRYEMTYVLLFGNVTPRFSHATVSKQFDLTASSAIITKADGNIAYEINNMRAVDYFESIGLVEAGKTNGSGFFIPLLMTLPDRPDEIPFVRALFRIDADGSAVFRGKIIEGAEFSFGSNSCVDVLSSTANTVAGITKAKDANATLFFSCIIRQLVVGVDSMKELALVRDMLGGNVPFLASYAVGEISPTSVDENNNACNRFHNYTFISCLL